jgi:Mg-chelatase subunit ChlD
MNPENPIDPRQALEPSLTAFLLGELPDDQARFIRQAIATDPELAKVFERLKKTTELIRETETRPLAAPAAPAEAPKLSDARREELLHRFKTVQPEQFKQPARRSHSWLVPVAAVFAMIVVLSSALLPALSRSKARAQHHIPQSESLLRRGVEAPELAAGKPMDSRNLGRLAQVQPQNDDLALYYAKPPATPLAEPQRVFDASPFQSTIVLPAEGKPETLTLSGGENQLGARNWSFVTPAQTPASASKIQLSKATDADTLFSSDGRLIKEVGTIGSPKQQAPTLGDIPRVGGRFWDEATGKDGLNVAQADQSAQGRLLKEAEREARLQSLEPRGPDSPLAGGISGGLLTAPQRTQKGQPEATQQRVDSEKQPSQFNVESGRDLKTLAAVEVPPLEKESALRKPFGLSESETLDQLHETKEKASEELAKNEVAVLNGRGVALKKQDSERAKVRELADRVESRIEQADLGVAKPATPTPAPPPEVQTRDNTYSTFALNISDVSFKLAGASLEKGVLPDPASIRSEEFINAFDYRDPEPLRDMPVAFAWERARYPFAQNRDVLRFSIKTAAGGRSQGQPLNIVLLLDNSGSMERADRVSIIHEALRVLATQLQAQDTFSVVTFARTARLWLDGVPGTQAAKAADELSGLTPQGGTNLEEAINLAYQTALRHYVANGINRVVLLTDGAANLGDTDPEALKKKVETNRQQGIALDCFGIGWEGYNDDLLEILTRHGDGRYGFLNTPEEAATEFAGQLAGALHVAASDVKVQVEFNANRVTLYRQIGYAHHQLTKEQFRDNTVDAAEIGAAESGNALYLVETNPQGDGALATVRVRYKVPGSGDYREHEWTVPFAGVAVALDQASPALRLATTAASFSEWLAASPYAAEVTCDRLLSYLRGVPAVFGADPRPQKLEWMIRQTKALVGK